MDSRKQLDPTIYKTGTQLLSGKFSEGNINTKFDYDYLKDIPENAFSNGIKKILENYQYKSYPAIATIRKYCGYDLSTISKQAINVVLFKAVKKVRDTMTLSFVDKALNAVANRYGGHRVMQFWSEQDWLYNQKAMIDLYDGFVRAGVCEDKVVGSFEANIDFKQKFETFVIWIDGDVMKCKSVAFNKNHLLEYPEKETKWLKFIGEEKESSQYKEIENLLTLKGRE